MVKVSYDYEDMINELKADIEEGLIDYEDMIRIERGETQIATTTLVEGIAAYSPIIDYLFPEDEEIKGRTYEKMTVKGVLFEMEHYNKTL
ncbi:hypothetical protein [Macrococcoides caseolyticum]|uniref:Uncharacterized protein n=1 Tax=Macrococcoides caseolyticum TaxID=69966 RepID=A0ACC9MUH4_9STAP|nr:hypothetical protein [Macrococcus caseolyticus]PKE39922.1 hypothetical protein CW675_03035 [Macrococcus caseolyticus]PKE57070.1 hypothetical protein CW682_02380 [Macrococcus caseolyticus]